ncbi:CHC2 zinc finger domain-containing protein [Bacteroides reticulotermitis]|uniref:DNA primase n=1 Tax=Bacteroides reticulotermitis TaxID=1133319 RepID=A0A840CXT0_9BACE|nr:DNA primase [Bacteroides reticulotermitis]
MDIPEIKSRLSIESVLRYYVLRMDGNSRLCCPFHSDRTPSLQVYPQTTPLIASLPTARPTDGAWT